VKPNERSNIYTTPYPIIAGVQQEIKQQQLKITKINTLKQTPSLLLSFKHTDMIMSHMKTRDGSHKGHLHMAKICPQANVPQSQPRTMNSYVFTRG